MSEVYDMWTGGKRFEHNRDNNPGDGYLKNTSPNKKVELDSYVRDELLKVIKDMEVEKEERKKEEAEEAKEVERESKETEEIEGDEEAREEGEGHEEESDEVYEEEVEEEDLIDEPEEVFEFQEEVQLSPQRRKAMKINTRIKKRLLQLEKSLTILEEEDIEVLRERIASDIEKSIEEDPSFYETWYLNFKYNFEYGDRSYADLLKKDDNLKIKALVNHKDLVDFAGSKFKKDFEYIKYIQNLRYKFKKGQIDKKEIRLVMENIEKLQAWIASKPLVKIYNYIFDYYQDLGRRINYDLYSKEIEISSDLDVEYQRGYLALESDERMKYELEISKMLYGKYMEILKNSKDLDKVQRVQESFKGELDFYRSHLDEILNKGLRIKRRKFYEGDLRQIAKFIPLFFMMAAYIVEGKTFSIFSIVAVTAIILSNSLWILDGVAEIKKETETSYNLEWSEVLISLALFGTGIWTIINPSQRSALTEAIMSLSGVVMVISGILAAVFWERVEIERIEDGELIEDYKYRFHGINFLGHGIKARKKKQIESLMKCEYKDVYYDYYFQGAKSSPNI